MHQMQLHVQRIQLIVLLSALSLACEFFVGQKGYYVSDSRKLGSDDTYMLQLVYYVRRI